MEWCCGNCVNTDQADMRQGGSNTLGPGYYPARGVCRRCRQACDHHVPWPVFLAWLERGCAICGLHQDLQIDHDRRCCPGDLSCGRCARGLVCGPHNRLVRNIEDGTTTRCQAFITRPG